MHKELVFHIILPMQHIAMCLWICTPLIVTCSYFFCITIFFIIRIIYHMIKQNYLSVFHCTAVKPEFPRRDSNSDFIGTNPFANYKAMMNNKSGLSVFTDDRGKDSYNFPTQCFIFSTIVLRLL